VLVATPGSLNIALQSGAVSPTLVNHVVIDEADTLMDDSFSGLTAHILRQLSVCSTYTIVYLHYSILTL